MATALATLAAWSRGPVIREAADADLDALGELGDELYRSAETSEMYDEKTWRKTAKLLLDHDEGRIVVAEIDARVEGYAAAYICPSNINESLSIGVGVGMLVRRPAAGLSKEMVGTLERWLKDAGACMVVVNALPGRHEALRRLYTRMGYRLNGYTMMKDL